MVHAALVSVASLNPTRPEGGREYPPQPIDVLTLAGVMKALGDQDAEIMGLYAGGVPVGLNIDLPRTPAVEGTLESERADGVGRGVRKSRRV